MLLFPAVSWIFSSVESHVSYICDSGHELQAAKPGDEPAPISLSLVFWATVERKRAFSRVFNSLGAANPSEDRMLEYSAPSRTNSSLSSFPCARHSHSSCT